MPRLFNREAALDSASQPSISANSRFQFAGADAVFIGKILFGIDGILFLHNLVKTLISHNDSVQYGVVIIFEMVLL